METIKSFVLLFCIASIISALFVFVSPDGRFRKIFTQIVSLVFLCLIINSIIKFDLSDIKKFGNFSDVSSMQEEYSDEMFEYILDSGSQVTKKEINRILSPYMTGSFEISVFFRSEGSAIAYDKIIIYISDVDILKIQIIKAKVGELTGITPDVIVDE